VTQTPTERSLIPRGRDSGMTGKRWVQRHAARPNFGTALSQKRITSRLIQKRRELLIADYQRLMTLFCAWHGHCNRGLPSEKTFESSERPKRFSLETKGEKL